MSPWSCSRTTACFRFKPGIKRIAVVGPLADQTRPLIGNYAGQPTHIVSILDGLHAEFPNAAITFVPRNAVPAHRWNFRCRTAFSPLPTASPASRPTTTKVWCEVGPPQERALPLSPAALSPTSNLLRVICRRRLPGEKPSACNGRDSSRPTESGDFILGIRCEGFARLTADGKQVAVAFGGGGGPSAGVGRVHLEKGHKVALSISYGSTNGKQRAELIWDKVNNAPSPEAIAAAKNADAVIAVVGITSQLEGEEMPVSEPGFLGGDRTSIDLPQPEEELVEAVAATGKPLAVVLLNGSALAVNWINEHANAVLDAWYPGEEGGAAVAETLSGKNNPAGRLPVTFYTGVNQLPNFEDYGMANRTYRYFNGKPLYPFGYGLSYTTSTTAISAWQRRQWMQNNLSTRRPR